MNECAFNRFGWHGLGIAHFDNNKLPRRRAERNGIVGKQRVVQPWHDSVAVDPRAVGRAEVDQVQLTGAMRRPSIHWAEPGWIASFILSVHLQTRFREHVRQRQLVAEHGMVHGARGMGRQDVRRFTSARECCGILEVDGRRPLDRLSVAHRHKGIRRSRSTGRHGFRAPRHILGTREHSRRDR
jgi:hypothetical protein